MTYIMWHEEHLWNANVLQRVHLSNLVWCSSCSNAAVSNLQPVACGLHVALATVYVADHMIL
jgi:hypothetical protein